MKARLVDRPLPGTTQIYRGRVSTGGTVVIGPFHVFVGGRHKAWRPPPSAMATASPSSPATT